MKYIFIILLPFIIGCGSILERRFGKYIDTTSDKVDAVGEFVGVMR